MTSLFWFLLDCRCLRGVDWPYGFGMPACDTEKAFTVSHISAQLFRNRGRVNRHQGRVNRHQGRVNCHQGRVNRHQGSGESPPGVVESSELLD